MFGLRIRASNDLSVPEPTAAIKRLWA